MNCRLYTDVPGPNRFHVDARLTVITDIAGFKERNTDLYLHSGHWLDGNGRPYILGRVSPMCVRIYRNVRCWFLWRAVAIDGGLPTYARRQLIVSTFIL